MESSCTRSRRAATADATPIDSAAAPVAATTDQRCVTSQRNNSQLTAPINPALTVARRDARVQNAQAAATIPAQNTEAGPNRPLRLNPALIQTGTLSQPAPATTMLAPITKPIVTISPWMAWAVPVT